MSDLCVLTATLLVQGKVPGWQAATPPVDFWTRLLDPQSVANQMCSNPPAPTVIAPTGSLNRPAFSPWTQEVAMRRFAKPATGSQLYAQRLAALRSGQLYTRLTPDSFQAAWEKAAYPPNHEDWVTLLAQEAKAISDGQGRQHLSILLGDSLAQWFPSEQLSRDRFWLNQGISGDTTSSILERLAAFEQTKPDSIYLMAGINDLRQGVSNQDILTNLAEIVRRLKVAHPQTQIYINSILPTRLEAISTNQIRQLNHSIASLSEQTGIHFVNLQPAAADRQKPIQVQFTTDGMRLSAQGYRAQQLAMTSMF
jgi:lysophospholipase L1-like esterase